MSEEGAGGGFGGPGPGGEGRRRRRRPRRRPRGPRGPGGPGPGGPFDGGGDGPNRNSHWNAPPPAQEVVPREAGSEFGANAVVEARPAGGEVAPTDGPNGGEPRSDFDPRPDHWDGASFAQRGEAERRPDGGFAQRGEAERRPDGWQNRGRSGRPQRGRGRGHGRPQRGNNQRARRGRAGENWWARRWVEVLERFAVGRRLGRGRNYARQGHIVDIEIGKGFVTAHVQGSRDAPYLVRMHFSMLSSTDWKKLTRALAQRPDIAVELGMGQIPESIEQVFEEQRLSLFPNASGDLKAACSCPDNANPCKHVAAVYYLLGEEFDRDPFLIFQLRGMERGELLAALGPAAIPRPPPPPAEPAHGADGERAPGEEGEAFVPLPVAVIEPPPERVIPDEPLPEDPEVFWGGAVRSRDEAIEVRIPRKPGAIVARLGGFPFWRGQSNCEAAMARTYRNASITGLDVYLGAGAVNEDDED
ncbi:MAG TPA: SWIM zinc finger family protein [Myxococcota bacterium]|nr:SWIM zinc finger family protein [Myxococcota bacterium]